MNSTTRKKSNGGTDVFDLFQKATIEKFDFLTNLYGFKHISTSVHQPECAIRYRNDTTGVIVFYEAGSAIWVQLSRLISESGKVVEGETYGLHLLAIERCPAKLVEPEEKFKERDDEYILKTLEGLAKLLQDCGDDVLRGDFKVFPRLRIIAEAELRRINKELFGSESGETT